MMPDDMARGADAQRRLRALSEFVGVVSRAGADEGVLRLVAVAARRALAAASVSLSRWETPGRTLVTLINEGELGPGEDRHPESEVYDVSSMPVMTRLVEESHGYVAAIGDLHAQDPIRELLESLGKASCLGVPIVVDGTVWGELWASRSAAQAPFAADDLEFARLVAVQAAAGVARAEHLARVERLAYTDDLTGLANRRRFEQSLESAVEAFHARGADVAVVILDVNGLRTLNNRHGHMAGDAALRRLGDILAGVADDHAGVVAARFGGDEFALLAPGYDLDVVVAMATRVCDEAAVALDEGVACGLAAASGLELVNVSPARLMRAADAAQYRAKQSRLLAPVVAGRRPVDDTPASPEVAARRRAYRDRSDDVGLVSTLVASVEEVRGQPELERVCAVAAAASAALDAPAWWVSRQDVGSSMVSSVRLGRVPGRSELAEPGQDYELEAFPATRWALAGHGVHVQVDDPDSDPPEIALLTGLGMRELLMAGGAAPDGTRWLVEVYGDDITAPLRPYVAALTAALALALTAAS